MKSGPMITSFVCPAIILYIMAGCKNAPERNTLNAITSVPIYVEFDSNTAKWIVITDKQSIIADFPKEIPVRTKLSDNTIVDGLFLNSSSVVVIRSVIDGPSQSLQVPGCVRLKSGSWQLAIERHYMTRMGMLEATQRSIRVMVPVYASSDEGLCSSDVNLPTSRGRA